MLLNPDFKDFIKSLNDSEVRYLVIGGYAVALHGHPRYTKDLDLWVDRTPENAARIVRALEAFGFGSLGLKEQDFLDAGQIIQLGYAPNRIDILTSVTGVEFSSSFAARVEVRIDDIVVPFIDLENLRKAKSASGRLQDLADLEHLQ